jgi:hypothetical protein
MIRGCPSSFDLILKSWEFHQHQYTYVLSLSCCCGDIRCVEMRAHIFHQRLSHGLNAMIGSPQALTHCALLLKKHTPKTWPCMLGSMVSCSHFIFCHLHLVSELLTFIYFGYTHPLLSNAVHDWMIDSSAAGIIIVCIVCFGVYTSMYMLFLDGTVFFYFLV